MLYCDYATYVTLGGAMTETQYSVWGPRASRKIDELTYGRAESFATTLSTELADACAQIADLMMNAQSAQGLALQGIVSASNDGYGESYAGYDKVRQSTGRAVYLALGEALGNDPYGLLSRGVD